jgi:hypothetical protein
MHLVIAMTRRVFGFDANFLPVKLFPPFRWKERESQSPA